MPTDSPAHRLVNPNPGHCRTCGIELASKRFQYCTEHRPAKVPPKARRRGRRITAAHEMHGPTGVVRELVAPPATGGGGVPSENEIEERIARTVVAMTWAVALRVSRGEPREVRQPIIETLMMTDTEAEALAHPIATRFAPTALNRRYGRGLIEALALTEPFWALGHYFDRVHAYTYERAQRERAIAAGQVRPIFRPVPPAASDPAGSPLYQQEGPVDDESDPAIRATVPPVTGWTGGPFGTG